MTQLSGHQQYNGFQALNFKFEQVAALPTFVAADEGRLIFVTTAGPDYGPWIGGSVSWVKFSLGDVTPPETRYRVLEEGADFAGAGAGTPQEFDILAEFGHGLISPGSLVLFLNGKALVQGDLKDYTVAGNIVTLNNNAARDFVPPGSGDELAFLYQVAGTGAGGRSTYRVYSAFVPAGPGVPQNFDINALFGDVVLNPADLVVRLNGLALRPGAAPNGDYTVVGNVVTFHNEVTRTPLMAGDEISFDYQAAGNAGRRMYATDPALVPASDPPGTPRNFDLSAIFGLEVLDPTGVIMYVNGQAKRTGATFDFSIVGSLLTYWNDPLVVGRYTLQLNDEVSFEFEIQA